MKHGQKRQERKKSRQVCDKKTFWLTGLSGLLVGMISGLLGAGGGMIAVPVLKKLGMNQKTAHANAVAVIMPVAAVGAIMYAKHGYLDWSVVWPFLPAGLVGSVTATWLLKKISPLYLRLIFGGFMIWAGVRLFLR